MKRAFSLLSASLLSFTWTFVLMAQPSVPRLVKFSGILTSADGRPLTGVTGVTFALYDEQQGGAPIWMETQNVQADAAGHYTATLGSTRNDGIPAEIFAAGKGRWLGVQPQGEPERPRALMTSVPYALKAVDAETLGGLPPSAFALANGNAPIPGHGPGAPTMAPRSAQPAGDATPNITGTGATNHLAYWTNSTTLASSAVYQAAGKKIGIGTTAPSTALEVDSSTASAIMGKATGTTGSFNGVSGQSVSTDGNGVFGINNATSGFAVGVNGQTTSPGGTGVNGLNLATTGGNGVQGQTDATSGGNGVSGFANCGSCNGVLGVNNGTSGFAVGVNGQTASPGATGVNGVNTATTGGNGVQGYSNATSGGNGVWGSVGGTNSNGVIGTNSGTSGFAVGVNGQTASPGGPGVNGLNTATTGGNGVQGQTNATSGGNGVSGFANCGSCNGVLGVNNGTSGFAVGVNGQTASPGATGVNGLNTATTGGNGVQGQSNATSGGNGVSGFANCGSCNGVLGVNNGTSGFAVGVSGQTASPNGAGVNGVSTATAGGNGGNFTSNATTGFAAGVYGQSASTNGAGVNGNAISTSGFAVGVNGSSNSPNGAGVFGFNNSGSGFGLDGQAGATGVAVFGVNQTCNSSGCTLVNGTAAELVTGATGKLLQGYGGSYSNSVFSVDGAGNGFFAGNLNVTGKVTKGSGSFMIDHPLDPGHKYLSHSFVESPDMMDVYNGMVRLDAKGQAWVDLPDYFEALNGDFRYQLTAVGAPSPRLYVAREVSHNRFKIAGGRPGGRVSWQVTGIRHDAFANAHRIPVTEVKPQSEQGRYLHPDVYGSGAANTATSAGLPE